MTVCGQMTAYRQVLKPGEFASAEVTRGIPELKSADANRDQ